MICNKKILLTGFIGCLLLGCTASKTAVPKTKLDPTVMKQQVDSSTKETMEPAGSSTVNESPEARVNSKLSPAIELMIKACDNYLSINPQSPKTAEVLAIKASVYYNSGLYKESRETYRTLYESFKDSPFGVEAVKMIAQTFYQQKEYDSAESWYRKLQNISHDGSGKQEALARIAESMFKMAELYESQQRFTDAAAGYERVALEFPDVKIADRALFNAGLCYEKLADWSRAILMYERLNQKYMGSELAPKSRFRTAKCYEKLFQWDNAAQTYLRLVAANPASDLAPAAIYNAGICFENAEKLREAAATFEKMAHLYPKSEEAADVLFKAGELYGKLKDWENVSRVNKEFTIRYGNDENRLIQALCMAGIALYMQNKTSEAVDQLKKAVDVFGKLRNPSAVNKYYAAKAEFTIGEIKHEDLNKIKLQLPESVYKNQLKIKSKHLQEAVEHYTRAAAYGISEWTTRGLFQIGQAYEDFAVGIFMQQRPSSSNLEQQLALEFGIAQAIEEYFINKALQFHEKNIKLGIKESLDDKFVLESKKKLTFLTFKAGSSYLTLADIARGTDKEENLSGLALIGKKLQVLQKIAPFQERAIKLFHLCMELGAKYQQMDDYYTKASRLITQTAFSVGQTYADVATIAREAPIPQQFDAYDAFVYRTKLLTQLEEYEGKALTNFFTALKVAEAYGIDDEYIGKSKQSIPKMLFMRGRSYDLLCAMAFNNPPFPSKISDDEKEEFKARFEELGLKFQDQAFDIYRLILKYAQEGNATGEFVKHAYVRLYQAFKEQYGEKVEKKEKRLISTGPQWKCSIEPSESWTQLEFDDKNWEPVLKGCFSSNSSYLQGFPEQVPEPMWCKQCSEATAMPERLFFRRVFYSNEVILKADLYAASSENFELYFNGITVSAADSTVSTGGILTKHYNLQGLIRNGKNILCVSVTNSTANTSNKGMLVFFSADVITYDFVPRPPGSVEPLDAALVAEGVYKFPYIKNFSHDSSQTLMQ